MDVMKLQATLGLDSSAYEKGLDRAKSLASSVGGGIASGFKTIAKGIGVALTAATGATIAFAKSAVSAGMDFDSSMSQVAATMGLTVDQLSTQTGKASTAFGEFQGNLRDFAQFLGKNTAFSATEAADALNYMALAGYNVQESMDMLPNVLSLAAAGNFDLARASDMVTDAQTAFGIDAKRTAQMVDEMAKAASTGNTSVEQLGDAFLVVGGLAQELNGGMVTLADGTRKPVDGLQELEIALTAMANAGVKGGEAGTHMRNMLLKLSSPTDAGAKQMEKLGVSVFDTEGKMRSLSDIFGDLDGALSNLTQEEKIQAISDLFNTRDLASAEALLNAVGQDWNEIGASILDAQGAAAQMAATQLDNLEGDITLFKSALEGAKIVISDQLTPTLREFVQFGTDAVGRLSDAFKEGGLSGAMEALGTILSEGLNIVITKLPDFVDAGVQLLGALGQGLMDNLDIIIDAGIQILSQFGQAIVTGLPAIIDAGLQILEALLGAMADNIDTVMEAGKQLIEGIVNAVSEHGPEIMELGLFIIETLFNSLTDNLPQLMNFATELIVNLISWISDNADQMIDSAIALIEALGKGIVENLPKIIKAAIELIITLAEALTDPANLSTLLETGLQVITTIVESLIENIPALVDAAIEIVNNLVDFIVDNIDTVIDAAIKIIGALVEGILSNMNQIIAASVEIILALVDGLMQALPQLIAAAPKLIGELVSAIIKSLPQVVSGAVQIIVALVKGIVGAFPMLLEAGARTVVEFVGAIAQAGAEVIAAGKEMINEVWEGIKSLNPIEWGRDLIDSFIDGIKERISRVADAARDVAQTVKDILGFSEPEEGPLSNFHTFAPDMMDLFIKGVKDNTKKLQDQVMDSFNFGDAIINANIEAQGSAGNAVNGSPVTINVYGAEGQNVNELADAVQDRILHMMGRTGAVYA